MLPKRKKLPHEVPSWVKDGALYFITINCKQRGHNHLCRDEIASKLKEGIAFRHNKGEWWVRLVVLMPDHLHMLVSFSRENPMAKSIANWKRFTARNLKIEWQRDFFDHRIRSLDAVQEKEQYLRMNPARKGLFQAETDWRYTWTAGDFIAE